MLNCIEITEALGYDPARYRAVGVASFWTRSAGYRLLPTHVEGSPAMRAGLDQDELDMVIEYHTHEKNRRLWNDWESRRDAAQQIVDFYDNTSVPRERWNMDPAIVVANVGEEPVYDQAILDAAGERKRNLVTVIADDRKAEILEALRSYGGPMNRRGYPQMRHLRIHAGFYIYKRERNALWPEAHV